MLTTEQKINEIYEYIEKKKRQEKINFIIKWFFRIVFFIYFLYAIFVLVPTYMEKYKTPISKFKNLLNKENLEKIEEKQKNILEKLKKFLKKQKQKNNSKNNF